MKIAILGAAGFLGKYLSQKLRDNYDIITITRDTLNLLDYNRVEKWLTEVEPDVIINCIANGGGTRIDDINYSDVQKDLTIFLNFYNSTHKFRFINIGSGAEFDRRRAIHMAKEQDILSQQPLESYGFAKNIISRLCLEKENFYTLRLFGCFDVQESDNRLFKKFLNGKINVIDDKWFDYMSADDFSKIIEHYCVSKTLIHKDINCVYQHKFLISEILEMLIKTHKLDKKLQVNSTNAWGYYTGDGSKLAELNLTLAGLEEGIKKYV